MFFWWICGGESVLPVLLLRHLSSSRLDSIFKSRDITLPTKVRLVKAMFFLWSCVDVRVGLWRRLSAKELMLLNCGVEKTLESPLDCKEIQPVHSEGDQPWDFFGRNAAKAETSVLWPLYAKSWLIGKDSDAGRDWGQEEKGTTEDEMAGWYHWFDGQESEWTPGVGEAQGGLACCDSWGRKESDMTERLIWSDLMLVSLFLFCSKFISTIFLGSTYKWCYTVSVFLFLIYFILHNNPMSNAKRWCCESAALNMPENLKKSAVATGLEKISFHSNPKERQCQRTLKLPHNCTHLTSKVMLKILQARL